MERQDDREWYSGESRESFAAAARIAVDKAEAVIDGEKLPEEYDVRLQVLAEGPLSGYRVLVSPTG
jgi:flavin-binding protein dodecin